MWSLDRRDAKLWIIITLGGYPWPLIHLSELWLPSWVLLIPFSKGSLAVSRPIVGRCSHILWAIHIIRLIVERIVLRGPKWVALIPIWTHPLLPLHLHLSEHLLLSHYMLEMRLPHGLKISHPHHLLILVAAAKLRALSLLVGLLFPFGWTA